MVELALVLPVLMLIMVIAIDFGRLFSTYIGIHNAAREGAAYGATHPTDNAGITTRARNELGGDAALNVSKTCASSCTSTLSGVGNRITVSVTRQFVFITPLAGSLFGGNLTLEARATAPIL